MGGWVGEPTCKGLLEDSLNRSSSQHSSSSSSSSSSFSLFSSSSSSSSSSCLVALLSHNGKKTTRRTELIGLGGWVGGWVGRGEQRRRRVGKKDRGRKGGSNELL